MRNEYICYCGLYCENCAVKAKVEPAAKALYREMQSAEFEEFIDMMPNGGEFWGFLKDMAENGTCTSCRDGSGNPACGIRICAREKGIDICTRCEKYPCELFRELFAANPTLAQDNTLMRGNDLETWAALQDRRRAEGFTYADAAIKHREGARAIECPEDSSPLERKNRP